MKQGNASSNTTGGRKREPIARAIDPEAVAQIGASLGNHATDGGRLRNVAKTLYSGRGFEAPRDSGREVHNGGSQRRYR
jgi:hypothetical protein